MRSSRRTATPMHAVVLDLEGVDLVDSQGAAKLTEILDFADSLRGRAAPRPRQARGRRRCSRRTASSTGSARTAIHGNVHRAVEAQLAADRSAGRRERLPVADD